MLSNTMFRNRCICSRESPVGLSIENQNASLPCPVVSLLFLARVFAASLFQHLCNDFEIDKNDSNECDCLSFGLMYCISPISRIWSRLPAHLIICFFPKRGKGCLQDSSSWIKAVVLYFSKQYKGHCTCSARGCSGHDTVSSVLGTVTILNLPPMFSIVLY